jgi:Predicted membrane protein (DUF2142)
VIPRTSVALIGLGYVLLLTAWLVATPPFGAPDEASHYLRALTIAQGSLVGPKIPYPNVPLSPTQQTFINQDTTAVLVPARLSPPDVACIDGKPNLIGRCFEATPNGTFPPLGYVLPAVALSVATDASSGLWLSRVASMIPCVAFILLAVALLRNRSRWSVLGVLAATTPMVLFASSVMNSSGIEITACLAFVAALLRIARAPTDAPGWVWLAFGLTGAVAIISWPLGPVFVIADVALFAALLGQRGLRALRNVGKGYVLLTMLTLLAACAVWLVYSRLAGFARARFGVVPIRHSLILGLDQLHPVLRDVVGTFGALTVTLPAAAYWVWWGLVLVALAGGLWLGERRDRLIIATVTVLALAFPVLFYAWVDRFTGFGLQGREVLPVLTLIPFVAGEVIYRRLPAGRSTGPALAAAVTLIALFQAYAWWYAARAAAGAGRTTFFFAHATWRPPLGWPPWIAAAALGTAALLGFAATEGLRGFQPRTAPSG